MLRIWQPLSQKSKIFASSPYTGAPLVAIGSPLWYNISNESEGKHYAQNLVRLPWQYLSQSYG